MAVLLLLLLSCVLVVHTSQQNGNRWTPMPPANNDEYTHVPSNTLVKKRGYYSSFKPVTEIVSMMNNLTLVKKQMTRQSK